MGRYLLSVWHNDDYEVDFTSDAAQRLITQVGAFNQALADANAAVYGAGLEPVKMAKVSLPNGDVTPGGYAGGPEQMGGFWIIEAADDDAATEWCRQAAAACEAPVELRPFQPGQ